MEFPLGRGGSHGGARGGPLLRLGEAVGAPIMLVLITVLTVPSLLGNEYASVCMCATLAASRSSRWLSMRHGRAA
jgi:hypothetical protein